MKSERRRSSGVFPRISYRHGSTNIDGERASSPGALRRSRHSSRTKAIDGVPEEAWPSSWRRVRPRRTFEAISSIIVQRAAPREGCRRPAARRTRAPDRCSGARRRLVRNARRGGVMLADLATPATRARLARRTDRGYAPILDERRGAVNVAFVLPGQGAQSAGFSASTSEARRSHDDLRRGRPDLWSRRSSSSMRRTSSESTAVGATSAVVAAAGWPPARALLAEHVRPLAVAGMCDRRSSVPP